MNRSPYNPTPAATRMPGRRHASDTSRWGVQALGYAIRAFGRRSLFSLLLLPGLLFGCEPRQTPPSDGRLRVVATTTFIADLVREIGGEDVEVIGLMGPGVDPHLYKASEGDVLRMGSAELLLYHGLHLEGRLADVLAHLGRTGVEAIAVAEGLNPEVLLPLEGYAGQYDPHVWFDVRLWSDAAARVGGVLAERDAERAPAYRDRTAAYRARLDTLDAEVRAMVATLEPDRRVLVTAHDAFGYFGRAYGFEVVGLQGISTVAEAGTADVQALSELVASRRIPALFVEYSVPRRTIEAVQAAVRDRGHQVEIGGSLYSDALGSPGTPEGDYIGAVRHNVKTIVDALSGRGD